MEVLSSVWLKVPNTLLVTYIYIYSRVLKSDAFSQNSRNYEKSKKYLFECTESKVAFFENYSSSQYEQALLN